MHKEYTLSSYSFTFFIINLIALISVSHTNSIPVHSRSFLFFFALILCFIGLNSATVYYKKYLLIEAATGHVDPILTSWHYSLPTSDCISNTIKEQRNCILLSITLLFILMLVFAFLFIVTPAYMTGFIIFLLSLVTYTCLLVYLSDYYRTLIELPAEAIFCNNYIYFADTLYLLDRTFYALENITITSGEVPLLQFLYSQYDLNDTPSFSISIPIPEGKLDIAKHLRKYYLNRL